MKTIEKKPARNPRPCGDDEAACAICDKPVKLTASTKMVHVHNGGSHVVTEAEAATLSAGGDLGLQPIGSDCLRRNPDLKPYTAR